MEMNESMPTLVDSQLLSAIYHHLSRSDLKRRSPKKQGQLP